MINLTYPQLNDSIFGRIYIKGPHKNQANHMPQLWCGRITTTSYLSGQKTPKFFPELITHTRQSFSLPALYHHLQTMLFRATHSTLFSASLPLKPTTTLHPRNLAVSASAASASTTFSISDDGLQSRGFTLHRTLSDLNLDQLNTIFVAVGFPRRDPDKIRIALENTDSLIWIQYEKTQKPVAFARATGDGVFNAIIWDVVVDPSFQGIGLGKAVMERLIDDLVERGISNIALYSEPRVLGFYRPLGFVADPDGIRGMVYSRKQQKRK